MGFENDSLAEPQVLQPQEVVGQLFRFGEVSRACPAVDVIAEGDDRVGREIADRDLREARE